MRNDTDLVSLVRGLESQLRQAVFLTCQNLLVAVRHRYSFELSSKLGGDVANVPPTFKLDPDFFDIDASN